jgi:hypothetical protein
MSHGKVLGFLALVALSGAGCAGSEPPGVLGVGSRNLRCSRSELSTTLNRTTPEVREYLVGCDFMYTRVHCTKKGCYPAEVKPPCIGQGPCFEEDPVTLRWRLQREVARSEGEQRH